MAKDPIKALEALGKKLEKKVAKVLDECVFKIRRRVTSQEFLKWRTKRRPIVVEKAKLVAGIMTATVRGASRWTWGHVHIGEPGSTTISPKRGRYLALPTDFVKTFRGHPVGPRRYSGTFVRKGVIFGLAGWHGSSGIRQYRAAGERFEKKTAIPLFILQGSVVVRRRIIPSQLLAWIQPHFLALLKKEALVP